MADSDGYPGAWSRQAHAQAAELAIEQADRVAGACMVVHGQVNAYAERVRSIVGSTTVQEGQDSATLAARAARMLDEAAGLIELSKRNMMRYLQRF